MKAYSRDWNRQNAEKRKQIKRRALLKRYGLTLEAYEAWLIKQHNKCRICLRSFDEKYIPNVDHNHATGKVRGILCSPCNRSIGLLKESPFILARIVNYLRYNDDNVAVEWLDARFADFPAKPERIRDTEGDVRAGVRADNSESGEDANGGKTTT